MTFRKWLLVAIALFAAGIALGLTKPELFAGLIMQELERIQGLAKELPLFTFSTFLAIFARNAIALLVSFALSPLLLLAPLLSLVSNGMLLSFVTAAVARERSALFVLGALLPHGVIEIPALIIGQAAALSFGVITMQSVFSRKKRSQFVPAFRIDLKYLGIALGLLLPAAAMETYVSPLFIR